MADWNLMMRLAYSEAQQSRDPSTQNGAVLLASHENRKDKYSPIISFGVNNFPTGVSETEDRWERPKKYAFIEHAERTAILRAAHYGLATNGGTLVCPWAACADCARAIVVAGLSTLVRVSSKGNTHERWDESVMWGDEIMKEGGVEIIEIDYKHSGQPIVLRRNGKELIIK